MTAPATSASCAPPSSPPTGVGARASSSASPLPARKSPRDVRFARPPFYFFSSFAFPLTRSFPPKKKKPAAFQLVTGRVWKGSAFGGVKGRSQLPGLVTDYLEGRLKVDEFITHRKTLAQINEAFEVMKSGDCIRAVVNMRE